MTVSVYFDKKEAVSEVQLTAAERKTTRIYHAFRNVRQEYAFVEFELETDLRPLFHWNTKQVFVYVVASYASSIKYPYNEVMVWNRIVKDKKKAVIRVKEQKNINKNVTLSMYYNVMPQVGLLIWGNGKPSGRLPFSVSR
ncbi:signal peptidase complex subunit SPC3 [Pneumocystis jirovecii RU7]|uniref:Signal peptidase subunit 3 n=1 Tax=Pneumocystis jirovecii (strain RU7) TaxID=1408657 RepID=A0A0W4ZW98_PNEJ7|nr:signal peptidase complex subunit SPC3 [Pneumocystis jirovecii RU7]KTW32651.1 hypothetical protein T551_00136 [Pneumocystis jirovecii RU7]